MMHDSRDHPPGANFVVNCVGKTGMTVSFTGQSAIDATFTEQEDVDYFEVGKTYAVDFRVSHAGGSGGGDQPQSQS